MRPWGWNHEDADAGDNDFVPSENFAQLAAKGGLQQVFQQEDIAPIAQVLSGLYQQRNQVLDTIYQITGISDIDGESSTLIRIIVVPNSRDIVSLRNQILELDLINTTVTGVIDSIAVGDDSGGSSYAAPSASVSPSGTGY